MKKIDFDALTIADDFMFSTIFGNPDNIDLTKRVLELFLGRKICAIHLKESQAAVRAQPGARGVRFDLLIMADGFWADLEMQTVSRKDLLKRARYYHSTMNVYNLKEGQKVGELPDAYVIFICMFDFFGLKME